MNAQRQRLLGDGLAAGLIGYVLVAGFFVVLNLVAGRSPFYTAALVGEAIFSGLRDPSAVTLAAGPILAFNGLHILGYILFGFFAGWLVYETELHPQFWYLAFFLFLAATVLMFAVVLAIMTIVESPVPAWSVLVASLLAAVGMAGYLTGSHRSLVGTIREGQETRPGRME